MKPLSRLLALLLLVFWSGAPMAEAPAAEPGKPPACPPGSEATPAADEAVPDTDRPTREPGQLLLFWPDAESADQDLLHLEKTFGIRPAEKVTLDSLGGVVALLRFAGDVDIDAARRRLRLSMRGATVDFNTRYYFEAGPRQYFQRQIRLPLATPPGLLAPIGMIDGPVESIPALRGVTITRKRFLGPNESASSPRHGTAVACLATCNDSEQGVVGSAAGAPLFSAEIMRVEGERDSTTTLMLVRAIDWLLSRQVRVINLSLGGKGDALMARTFERLARLPVVVVAAAGNGGPDAPPSFPAAYPGVLAVTATNAAFEVYRHAGRGPHIGIAAPGEAVWVPDRENGRYVSGTSYATALVSGAVARLLGAAPEPDPAAIRNQLCRHALDLGIPGVDRVFGCGLLQIAPLLTAGAWAGLP